MNSHQDLIDRLRDPSRIKNGMDREEAAAILEGTVCSRCGATVPHTQEECRVWELTEQTLNANALKRASAVKRAIKHLIGVECSECARIVNLLNELSPQK